MATKETAMDILRRSLARVRRLVRRALSPGLPLNGFEPARTPAPWLDRLTDDQLARLNRLLPWNAFTVDARGRRFGNAAWAGKRSEPQPIPDPRILLMDQRFGLAGKRVLEVGCFEGIHTVALAQRAASVVAIDARVENVVKTVVRAAFYGLSPTVFACDVEERPLPSDALRADLLHHVGVLYHLVDPVAHLRDLAPLVRIGLMMDTHYCTEAQAGASYASGDRSFKCREFQESGRADPFSGMHPRSRWLLLEDLVSILRDAGFGDVEVAEKREERNGPRALIFARKRTAGGGA